jgi:GNAT superfamily N-acetyltransferase
MASAPARIVELDATPAGLALLKRFHDEGYVAQFPDADEREPLAQLRRYLRLKSAGWYGANNYHVLVAMQGGAPVGGMVLDYLALPQAGVIEFLFVLPAARGQGLGRRLLRAGLRCLRADARAQGQRLRAVAAEMNDPFRRPSRPDNMDPFARAATWGRWGFCQLLCPYAQPALSAAQQAVDYLMLIVRPLGGRADSVAAAWVRSLVAEYLRWAMRVRQPLRQPEYRRLDTYLAGRPRVPLLPLLAAIGHGSVLPLQLHEVRAPGHRLDQAARLAQSAIPVPGHGAAPGVYRQALAASGRGGMHYHLWALSAPGSRAVQGMASFFSLPSLGFGGYLVLAGPLRGRGLLAPLLARMEARMRADDVAPGVTQPGSMIECAADTAPLFMRQGYARVPLVWRPPALTPGAEAPELQLLYKPLGAAYPPIWLEADFVRRALREILLHVYGVAQPARHASYRLALTTLVTLATDGGARVALPD